jgi:hypothetical protein
MLGDTYRIDYFSIDEIRAGTSHSYVVKFIYGHVYDDPETYMHGNCRDRIRTARIARPILSEKYIEKDYCEYRKDCFVMVKPLTEYAIVLKETNKTCSLKLN